MIHYIKPGPRCARCGHPMCPICGDWCDTLIGSGGFSDDDPCCDGRCEVNRESVDAWLKDIPLDGEMVMVEGPSEFP